MGEPAAPSAPPTPASGPPDAGRSAALRALLRGWRPTALALFWILLPVFVVGRVTLSEGIGVGFKSLARNVVILVLVGAFARADRLRFQASRLAAPLFVYLAVVWLSVLWNGGYRGEARLLSTSVGLFIAVRALLPGREESVQILHWIGLFVCGTVLAEVIANPGLLAFDLSLRDHLRFTHPNTLGGAIALLLPVFTVFAISGRVRGPALLYILFSCVGLSFCFSRSGLLAALAGLALVAVAHLRRRGAFLLWTGAALGAGVAGIVAVLSMGRTEADLQRLRILATSLSLFAEHWPLGIGFGIENLRAVFPARYIESYGHSLFLFHSHNLYVEMLVGTGVVGAAAGCWLLARLVGVAVAGYRGADEPGARAAGRTEAAGYLASAVVLLLLGLTDSLFYQSELLTLIVLLWALMETRVAKVTSPESPPAPEPSRASPCAP